MPKMAGVIPSTGARLRVILGGNLMLGRGVATAIQRFGADYPLAPIRPLLESADMVIANLECAISDAGGSESAQRPYCFATPSVAACALAGAGVSMLSLANNHVLDFGPSGLRDTIAVLDRNGIGHAGAGETLRAARCPALASRNGLTLGMAAWCEHRPDIAAKEAHPGIACLDMRDLDDAVAVLAADAAALRQLGADWPVLSLHAGPNWAREPSADLQQLARRAVAAGFRIVFCHGAHVFQGMEFHRGCPIIYGAGNLVDDYYVDPGWRNDRQVLIELVLSSQCVEAVRFHPVVIENMRVRPALRGEAGIIADEMQERCVSLGTRVRRGETYFSIESV